MKLTDDIHLFWKFWSVRFGLLALACGSTAAAYAALPDAWAHEVPAWLGRVCAIGSVGFTFLSVVSRGIDQPKLRQDAPSDS